MAPTPLPLSSPFFSPSYFANTSSKLCGRNLPSASYVPLSLPRFASCSRFTQMRNKGSGRIVGCVAHDSPRWMTSGEEGERDGPAEVAEAVVSSRWRDGVGVVRVEVGRVLLCDSLLQSVLMVARPCAATVPFGFSVLGAGVVRAVPASMSGSFLRGTYGRRDMVMGASGSRR